MPELPDISAYIEALQKRVRGSRLQEVGIRSPFLLRTANPPMESLYGRELNRLRRIGKRIAFGFSGDYWLVLHLMIAGRLHWLGQTEPSLLNPKSKELLPHLSGSPGKHPGIRKASRDRNSLASFVFETGTLSLTEAGTKKRASLHLVLGEAALREMDRGGLEVLDCTLEAFAGRLTGQNHTLKRALTDPRLFSGIGNAYSDEILHRAQLSPVALSQRLSREEIKRLHQATRETLKFWIEKLRAETGDQFPEKVTAFRPDMAVHGKYGKPCPVCGTAVQRIRYADNETNYCPNCQTGGKLLADRSLSLLLKRDWPRTLEELEEMKKARA